MYEVKRSMESGRVLAFWGPIHRQGAISTTTALVATLLADTLKGDEKLLVMSNDISAGPTAGYYMSREEMPDGLIEVVELADSDNIRGVQDIYNNTYSAIGDRVDILATRRSNVHLRDQLPSTIGKIFDIAKMGYKYVLVDTASGTYSESTLEVLKHCDMIIVCMPQDKLILDNWVRKIKSTYPKECDRKKTMIVVTQYWDYKHMDYAFMKKQLKSDLWYISLNDVVHEAVSNRDILNIIHSSAKSRDPDDVVDEVEDIIDGILKGLDQVLNRELVEEQEEEEEARRNTTEYIESLKAFDDAYEDTPLDSVTAERLLNIDKKGTGKTGWDAVNEADTRDNEATQDKVKDVDEKDLGLNSDIYISDDEPEKDIGELFGVEGLFGNSEQEEENIKQEGEE